MNQEREKPAVAARARAGLLLLLALSAGGRAADAEVVRAAVAANFALPFAELAAGFTARTGHRVLPSTGSTGMLFAQIGQGAPFDVFLAADSERPRRLEESGVAVPGSRFTYALGRLVLWSREPPAVEGVALLAGEGSGRLAIANPLTAPYGAAAEQALRRVGSWQRLQPRLVRGEDVGQTFAFVATGAAELGLVSAAQAEAARRQGRGGWSWPLPDDLYEPIEQQAVLLRPRPAAVALLEYLGSDEATALLRAWGYAVEAPAQGPEPRAAAQQPGLRRGATR